MPRVGSNGMMPSPTCSAARQGDLLGPRIFAFASEDPPPTLGALLERGRDSGCYVNVGVDHERAEYGPLGSGADAPGFVFEKGEYWMHTTDTLDCDIVVRGELILELDDGKTVHLRQGDCVVQNGTLHRWFNPLDEPCLMAVVMIGGARKAG